MPNLHFVGDEKTEDGKTYHVMVMDLLGKSLEDLLAQEIQLINPSVKQVDEISILSHLINAELAIRISL